VAVNCLKFRFLVYEIKGNPVKNRNGPAAVTRDERCTDVTDPTLWVGKAQPVG